MGEVEGLQNYYEIKQIVNRKWEHQDRISEEQLLLESQTKRLTNGGALIKNEKSISKTQANFELSIPEN